MQKAPFKLGTPSHGRPPEPTASDKIDVREVTDSPEAPYLRRRSYPRESFQPLTVPSSGPPGEKNPSAKR